MSDSTLGTFRVDKDDWDKFKSLCNEAGSSASAEIVAFIRSCNEQGSVGDRLPGKSELEKLEKDIDNRIEAAMAPLLGRIEKLEAIANDAEKLETMAENSPLRMAPIERNEPVRINHPEPKPKAVQGPETGGLTQSALNELLGFNRTDNRPRKWREAGPEILGKETKAILGTAYRFDESAGRFGAYFPVED
ncbi:hypothetical protein [Picosynechococcus sp. PCC 7117]|uniref:hypothetical protein n=1 Tax=Picosynechococcus sp. PCC 7117 TaxID=195498 RepID=UPI000810D486|nr:hypothetical protein [Picosynechococcus sp. PCC 7117]ANV88863.1 hypothetical protein AWQ22_14745 [Picosynechococcus sp. PCC 7117]